MEVERKRALIMSGRMIACQGGQPPSERSERPGGWPSWLA